MASTGDERPSESAAAPARSQGQAAHGHAAASDFKYTRFDGSPGSTHSFVVELVPEGSTVLEFGCATGYMSDVLASRGCRVIGVELDPEAAEEAEAYCERVIVGDAETLDLDEHLGDKLFDAVLFADVLEHLRDPTAMLRRVRPFIAEGGAVVASIPNVAHISVRLALLSGEFRYRDLGLLDDTHLRFFTRSSIVDLFESAGFVVSAWRRRRIELNQAEIDPPTDVPDAVRSWLSSDPELTTYQFVLRAVPTDAASQLVDLRASLGEAQANLLKLEAELDALRRAHEAQSRRLVAERLALANEVEREVETLREEIEWRKEVMKKQLRAFEGLPLRPLHGATATIRSRPAPTLTTLTLPPSHGAARLRRDGDARRRRDRSRRGRGPDREHQRAVRADRRGQRLGRRHRRSPRGETRRRQDRRKRGQHRVRARLEPGRRARIGPLTLREFSSTGTPSSSRGWVLPLLEAFERDGVGRSRSPALPASGRPGSGAGSAVDWNGAALSIGDGGDPSAFEHRSVRTIDYGFCRLPARASADLFREVGGFDPAYTPAYYEDADLCFKLHERGLSTVDEPGITGGPCPRRGEPAGARAHAD